MSSSMTCANSSGVFATALMPNCWNFGLRLRILCCLDDLGVKLVNHGTGSAGRAAMPNQALNS